MNAVRLGLFVAAVSFAASSATLAQVPATAAPAPAAAAAVAAPDYLIAPGDRLHIFVWKNPDLSTDVPVRPDGKISTPLAADTLAQGKTSSELAADLTRALSRFIQEPVVTVVVTGFAAPDNAAAIRVIGAAVTPKTVAYRNGMTALDVLIDVGGLSPFANGNGAELIRKENGVYKSHPLRLTNLLKSADLKANVNLMPGDIIRIPERWF